MSKDEFRLLFKDALEIAAKNADKQLGRPVPRSFLIEFHGLASRSRVLQEDEALEAIYLGPDRFYRVIDVAVRSVSKDACTLFMCISGHSPGSFNETWNQPPGMGPFKQLRASQIKLE